MTVTSILPPICTSMIIYKELCLQFELFFCTDLKTSGDLEVLVAWCGLQDVKNSWELARSNQHDVLTLVAK
ncbi:hypothetical protein CCR75_003968 [Bremia lactucae]|uniref:Chromo domain-containing protein n=1 Tax=Bremia lactucae TaxID=4779 RepID=A0A976IG94_BRELC|nr:hypothetical protein CCR75_003968 [Bremia lactucae]